jgi:RNA recognition motif-containing protein
MYPAAHWILATEPPLKRDRENSTVLVSGLSEGVEENVLKQLFKDVSRIIYVNVPY